MKRLFGGKHASKAQQQAHPSANYDDLPAPHLPIAQQHQRPDAQAVYTQAPAVIPPSQGNNIEHEHRHHQQQLSRQDSDRTVLVRKQPLQYRDSPSDEHWEFVQAPGVVQRDEAAGAAPLPNPHPPPLPNSRKSSLGSLPPGASPPVPAPLGSPLADGSFNQHSHTGNTSPAAISSPMPFGMLRKKPPQPKDNPPPPSANGIGSAVNILRALDPRIPHQQQQVQHQHPEKTTSSHHSHHSHLSQHSQSLARRNDTVESEIGHDSVSLDVSDEEIVRDSVDIERDREWRERDREIRSIEVQPVKHRAVDRDRERERERDNRTRLPPTNGREREKERDRDFDRDRLQPDNREMRRKKDGSRERSRSRERENKDDKKSQWAALFSKDARHDKEKDEYAAEQLSRMIGFLTAMANIDWSMALDICERASASDLNAKQAAKALRREFRYGEPASQLSAARLWAIMTQNCSEEFIAHTNSKKFVDCLEHVITSSRTSPVVRDRLIDVLGASVYKLSMERGDTKEPPKDTLRWLWRKHKPEGAPDEGIGLPSDDMLFSPTAPRPAAKHPVAQPAVQDRIRPDLVERQSSRANGVVPYDEDIRRLFQECKIGKGNAQLLNEALAFATPDDLKEKDIIKEFYMKCRQSQELIHTQIPWASAVSERSRLQQEQRRLQYGQDGPIRATREEELLAELLKSNEELLEALRIYDDIERIGVEREYERAARERSRVETRHTPSYQDEYLEPPASGMGSSGSRSPSPFNNQSHPLPPPPQLAFAPSLSSANSRSSSQVHSLPNLAPPARSVRGPRSPALPPRSRSPSPSRSSSSPSLPGSHTHSRNSSMEGLDIQRLALGTAHANGKLPSPLHVESGLEPMVQPPTPTVQYSEKALGKRREVEDEEDPRLQRFDDNESQQDDDVVFDSGDMDDSDSRKGRRECWKQPANYVYDAAAERTKEWLKESGSHVSLLGKHKAS